MHVKHDNFMQMAAPLYFGGILGIPYYVIHVYTCIHVHTNACMHGTSPTNPAPIHPPPTPMGGSPWYVYGLVGGWVDGWVDG